MPEVPNRSEREQEIAAAILLLLTKRWNDLDDSYDTDWDSFSDEIELSVRPTLRDVYKDSAEQLSADLGKEIDEKDIEDKATEWAEEYSAKLADEISQNTQNAIQSALDRQQKDQISDEEVEELVKKWFDSTRADKIGITETTRAGTAGEFGASGLIIGEFGGAVTPTWNTAEDASVCPICEPLDGTMVDVWGDDFPDGPPAHPNCRCFLDYDYEPGELGDEDEGEI